ncbi:MAG: hypothetical protein K1Y36_15105 [Blastocatellia bacterium]|nr:hypothetical protein [Blastocatellia bacterium]
MAEQLLTQYPDLKVLFMSGYIGDAIVHHGVSESSFAFLQKPFSAQELVQKIKQVLKQD